MAESYDWTSYKSSVSRQKNRVHSEQQRFSLSHSPEFQKAHPAPEFDAYGNPLSIQDKQKYWESVVDKIRPRNLDKEELALTQYNPNPNKGFFQTAEPALTPNYLYTYNNEGERSYGPHSFVSLDIETDDRQRPISIIAHRYQYDTKTHQFHSAGSFQRYYETSLKDVLSTHGIHTMVPKKLEKLREQQGATYSQHYFTDPREERELRKFIGSSAIVGQNVVAFDLPSLFPNMPLNNSIIDTVIAARNVWKNRPNGLDDIFKRVFKKSMAEAGLFHHDPNADTIATMMIFQEMTKWKGETGDAIRYVMTHPGTHLGTIDEMLNFRTPEEEQLGIVVKEGTTFRDIYRTDNRGELYMAKNKIRISAKEQASIADMQDLHDPLKDTDEELIASANKEYAARTGAGMLINTSETVEDLKSIYKNFGFWKKASLVRELSKARSENEMNALIESAGFNGKAGEHLIDMATRLRRVRERDDRAELDFQKERRVEIMKRRKQWLGGIEDEEAIKAANSFEELNDAIDKIIDKNQKLIGTYEKIGNIKLYDPNQYLQAAKQQWGGIMSASRGVLPNFIQNPLSRIGDAVFNYQEQQLTGWNAMNRIWNSGIGEAATGILGAAFGPIGAMAGMGVVGLGKGISQLYGNAKQQQMESFTLGIQNNLNTLGAMVSWISTPFRLLHRVTKLLIGSFSGLTGLINGLMKGGISAMSDIGNPLTELTGVGYSTYEGTTMMDVASLFNKGSMNSVYEDFAKQQKAFYTLGQVNTSRLIASSLLGVYSDVYNPSTDAAGSYNTMVNKLLASMQGQTDEQKARTMYLASEIDSNLPSLLRTANLLGVTDVNQLMDPRNRGMYWRTLTEDESQKFRWTQYEYGAATEQFGYTKMRLANTIWDKVGRDLYNGINRILDSVAGGDIQGAVDAAVDLWNGFKIKIQDVWKKIKAAIEGNGETDGWGKSFKIIGLQVMNIALEVAKGIVTIWDNIMAQLAGKAQGLIAYLSTISIKPHKNEDGSYGISIETINSSPGYSELKGKNIYNYDYIGETGEVYNVRAAENMKGFAALADVLHPEYEDFQKTSLTPERLYWEAGQYLAAGNSIDLSKYGYNIPGGMVQHASDIGALMDALAHAGSTGSGWREVAAWMQSGVKDEWKIAGFDDTTGIRTGLISATGQMEDALFPVIESIIDKNNKTILELRVTDSTGKVRAKTQLTAGESVITKNLIQLQQLVADGVNLVVQQVSGN